MRTAYLAAAALAAALLAAAVAGATAGGWHEPGTLGGGSVLALCRDADGVLYAATRAGVYTSADGVTWRRGAPLPGLREDVEVTAVAASAGGHVYAVAADRLFRSGDAGSTWHPIGAGLARAAVTTVAVAPGAHDVVYAGTTAPAAVYRSADGGGTWARTAYGVDEGGSPAVIGVARASPETAVVATLNTEEGAPSGGFYRTDDGGATWIQLSIGLPFTHVLSVAIATPDARTIYLGTDGLGVFETADGGFRWHRARAGLPTRDDGFAAVNGLAVDPAGPDVVYAATDRGLAVTRDGGASWRSGPDTRALSAVVADPSASGRVLAASLDGGVLASGDAGGHWQGRNDGLTAVSVMALAVQPTRPRSVLAGTYESGLARTADGGATWAPVPALGRGSVRALAFGPKGATAYAAVDDDGVFTSANGGTSWSRGRGIETGALVGAFAVDPRHPAIAYAATDLGVYRTVNAGRRWRASGLDEASAVAVNRTRPSVVYAAFQHEWRDVWRSRDGGKTWRRLAAGIRRGSGLRSLAAGGKSGGVYAAANRIDRFGLNGETGDAVYRLAPAGKRWTRIAAGLPRREDGTTAQLRSLAVNPRTGAVVVGTDLGLYRLVQAEGARRWQLADPIFARRTVRRLAFAADGSRLYAAAAGRLLVSR